MQSEGRARGLMMLSAGIYAVVPLWIGLGRGPDSPFLFTAMAHIAAIPFILAWLRHSSKGALPDRKSLQALCGAFPGHPAGKAKATAAMAALALCTASYALFSLACRQLGPGNLPIAAALFEAWPVMLICILRLAPELSGQRPPEPLKLGLSGQAALLLALMGLLLVIQAREESGWQAGSFGLHLPLGAATALLAGAASAGLPLLTLRLGRHAARALHGHPTQLATLQMAMTATVFMHVAGAVLSAAIGAATGESLPTHPLPALAMGGTIAAGAMTFRAAQIRCTRPGTTALSFLTPCLALGLLLAASQLGLLPLMAARLPALAAGAAAIFAASILLNAKPPPRDQVFILALWCTGILRWICGGPPPEATLLLLLPACGAAWLLAKSQPGQAATCAAASLLLLHLPEGPGFDLAAAAAAPWALRHAAPGNTPPAGTAARTTALALAALFALLFLWP